MARDIHQIIARLQAEIPGIEVVQLRVAHPGNDDDGLWFMRISGKEEQVQIESPLGACPFVIESELHPERQRGRTVEEVVSILKRRFSVDELTTILLP